VILGSARHALILGNQVPADLHHLWVASGLRWGVANIDARLRAVGNLPGIRNILADLRLRLVCELALFPAGVDTYLVPSYSLRKSLSVGAANSMVASFVFVCA
jgi:hypothetical protein